MASLMERLKEKQKADADRREARLEKRRGYAQAGRERERARRLAESGLDDLPLDIAVRLEELPAADPPPVPVQPDASSAELVKRLEAIKDRIFRLRATFAVSLSQDAAMEGNRFVVLFQDLARQLQAKDADALAALTLGHESLLLSPPVPVRQTIPLETQRLCELRWEVSQSPMRHIPKRPVENVPDGLSWML